MTKQTDPAMSATDMSALVEITEEMIAVAVEAFYEQRPFVEIAPAAMHGILAEVFSKALRATSAEKT